MPELNLKMWRTLVSYNFSSMRCQSTSPTGRWYGTPLNKRQCLLCNKGLIGDEFHYILFTEGMKINMISVS